MPILVIAVIRLFRALVATIRLLGDVALLRALPWRYIRRVPFRNGWIGVLTASLAGTVAACVALPFPIGAEARESVAGLGLVFAMTGLVSSWARAILQWRRLRR